MKAIRKSIRSTLINNNQTYFNQQEAKSPKKWQNKIYSMKVIRKTKRS